MANFAMIRPRSRAPAVRGYLAAAGRTCSAASRFYTSPRPVTVSLESLARLICVAMLLGPAVAAASGGDEAAGERGPRPRSPALLEPLARGLDGDDASAAHRAIDAVSRIRQPGSVRRLTAFLRTGQRDDLTDHALKALGDLGLPDAIATLVEFTQHRRAEARQAAYRALSAIDDPRVPQLLTTGLRDADARVRGATALALGEIGARQALQELFTAFELGVADAAVAIGRLADDAGAERFGSYLEKKSLAVMLSGYEQLLRRGDIAEKTKLNIVAALGELSSQVFSDTASTSNRQALPTQSEEPAAVGPGKGAQEERGPGRQIERFLGGYLASGGAKGEKALERFVRATILRIRGRREEKADD